MQAIGNRSAQRGQVLPLVAISLTVLLGIAALAVDVGYLRYQQRVQQYAVDSAAVAGAWQLLNGQTPQSAVIAAAASNGFTNDGTRVLVTANTPPQSGPYQSDTNAVEAIITVAHPAWFSSIFGRRQNWVSTRAVALIRGNSGACIWSLQKDLTLNHGTLTSPCGVMVTRNVNDNGATMDLPSIGAGGSAGNSYPGVVVTSGIPPFSDPCPTIPGCKAITDVFPFGSTPGPGPFPTCMNAGTVTTLNPGCYNSLSTSGTIDLTPGLYIIPGDVSATLTCTTCRAGTNGVTIVSGGKINLNGSTTNLMAPPAQQGAGPATVTTAGAPGVLFYQTDTTTSPENFSAQQLLGMLYAPGAHLNLDGGGSTLTISYVVGADIVANGAVITVPAATCSSCISQTPVLAE
jgi:Putative Flp pilus-assembly TadE/G-like